MEHIVKRLMENHKLTESEDILMSINTLMYNKKKFHSVGSSDEWDALYNKTIEGREYQFCFKLRKSNPDVVDCEFCAGDPYTVISEDRCTGYGEIVKWINKALRSRKSGGN